MVYDIIIGRNESDSKILGKRGLIHIGKHYVKMGQTTSLSNNVFLDVAKAHVILVTGKRGSGKSYTLAVIAEEISKLPEEVAKNIGVLIFDTMGIFWTMKFPNKRDEDLLMGWRMKPRSLDIDIYVPSGFFNKYKKEGIPVDHKISIKVNELNASDWCDAFNIKLTDSIGVLIEKTITVLEEEKGKNYSLNDIIKFLKKDKDTNKETINATLNRFIAAKGWGLFSEKGNKIKDIVKPGRVSVIDISSYSNVAGNWGIKGLVIGLIAKKLLTERIVARKVEEMSTIESGVSFLGVESELKSEEVPLVWILIDEGHEFLPVTGRTAATDALVQLLREGRQPGISLVLATQQPGKIHTDVMTQSDIVISHRLTAERDINALNAMMQTYLTSDIQKYLNNLPRLTGSAIILDDNSERIYPIRVRPRLSWHGGEAPTAVKTKSKEMLDLGL